MSFNAAAFVPLLTMTSVMSVAFRVHPVYCWGSLGSPRDEIARASDISVHERGGVIVDDLLRTNDEDIYAIGEVALHG